MYLFDLYPAAEPGRAFAGCPVPSGLSADDGLPVGLQIMAPAMADDRSIGWGGLREAARCAAHRALTTGSWRLTTRSARGDG